MSYRRFILTRAGNPNGTPPVMGFENVDEVLVPADDEIIVEANYWTVNYPDYLMTFRGYQLRPTLPFTLGSELLGTVVAAGPELKNLLGKRVHALTWHGAFSSMVKLYAGNFTPNASAMKDVELRPTPRNMLRAPLYWLEPEDDPKAVAAMGFAYSSAYHALVNRAHLVRGERVLVLGAGGGLGLAAVQIAAHLGAHVVAATRRRDSESIFPPGVESLPSEALLAGACVDGPFDVVFDVLGGSYTCAALSVLKPAGRLLIVGFVSSLELPSVRTNRLILGECSLVGTAWGSWASREPESHTRNFRHLLNLIRGNSPVAPVWTVYPWEELPLLLEQIGRGRIIGKALLHVR